MNKPISPETELSAADKSAAVTAETREALASQYGGAGPVEAALAFESASRLAIAVNLTDPARNAELTRCGRVMKLLCDPRVDEEPPEAALRILAAEVRRLQEFKDHYTKLAKANGFGSITEAVTAGRLYFQSQAETKAL
jgi:hypothetical protein